MNSPTIAGQPTVARTRAWGDYGLIDSGGGRKFERYGPVRVIRPEPQCLWAPALSDWKADAVFDPAQADEDTGRWQMSRQVPESWPLAFGPARFHGRLTSFRHLAFFPEQAANWEWLECRQKAAGRPLKILNLFGYTGVASLVCAAAGAEVTHVDASKKAVGWAKDNADLSGIGNVRWIVEDARKFVAREARRGNVYDGIILDPPKYGRGPTGEVWRLYEDLPELIAGCASVLSPDADFLLLNAYAERISGVALASLVQSALSGRAGCIDWGELALIEENSDRGVGLSFFARWTA